MCMGTMLVLLLVQLRHLLLIAALPTFGFVLVAR